MITYKIRHKWKLDLYKLQQFAIIFVYKTKTSINKTQRASIRHQQVERQKQSEQKTLHIQSLLEKYLNQWDLKDTGSFQNRSKVATYDGDKEPPCKHHPLILHHWKHLK